MTKFLSLGRSIYIASRKAQLLVARCYLHFLRSCPISQSISRHQIRNTGGRWPVVMDFFLIATCSSRKIPTQKTVHTFINYSHKFHLFIIQTNRIPFFIQFILGRFIHSSSFRNLLRMDLNDLNKVWEIKPLRRIRESEAKEILERVAKQVQPIMRKRKWKVRLLSEFSPANPSLLGLNVGGGAEIKLRLRQPNNELDFFPYNQILDTMLHELCHNEVGPHNADFYRLWDEIRKECEDLIARGITGTGQGFDLPGRRLGGFSRNQPPLSSLRQSALAAAENRAKQGALLPSGPKRLGGDSSIKAALSPIQAAAMAAERRLHDDVWCGGSESLETEGSSSESSVPPIMRRDSEAAASTTTSNDLGSSRIQFGEEDLGTLWECGACTFLNQARSVSCEVCGTKKGDAGSNAVAGGSNTAKSAKVWSCKFCTLDNVVGKDRCSACGEWRYSYGPPVSTRGPYLGT